MKRRINPCAFIIIAVIGAGCPVIPVPNGGSPADPDPMSDLPQETPIVTIHFRNLTLTEAVDVEFFLSDEALGVLPDDLFQETFRRRAQIGVAGTGIIEPLTEDVVTFECGPDLVLGTSGGIFLDNESGEVRGTGSARWVQESALGVCGHTVSFDFLALSGTQYDVVIRLAE